MEKYNGWTNYATWRVNLELFDGFGDSIDNAKESFGDIVGLSDYLKNYTLDFIDQNGFENETNRLVGGWASAFVDEVNWYEIAENMNEDYNFGLSK
jgi:hypothetical protein